jgi:hypothetical protein
MVTGARWGPLRAVMLREKRCEEERGGDDGAHPFLKRRDDMGRWWGSAWRGHVAEGVDFE